ncbi:thioesterase family protein [Williamsia deligens]|uniref:Thioesterase family protein n=1 Tax=Williamsia deligens TaxID=321325 RepID=A0ABW3G8I2_9NOCA|nr:thioesterase family protein [Williamsia deligens]MCP2192764.1 Thioesterase-like superfamily protein [Williamsia deligens]
MTHFFDVDHTDDGPRYRATEISLSGWGPDHVAGPAVTGLLAQVLDDDQGVDGFTPGRITVELLRPFRTGPTTVRTEVVRTGRRIIVCHAEAVQGDRVVAIATAVQYRRTQNAYGERWRPDLEIPAPPSFDAAPSERVAWYHSDSAGWTADLADHRNADRFSAWWRPPQVTAGREPGPYARVAMVAEWTSLVTNVGTNWVPYINGDLTIALTRLPESEWVGVQAMSHTDADGIAVGTSTLADEHGVIGSGMITAIANEHPDMAKSSVPSDRG